MLVVWGQAMTEALFALSSWLIGGLGLLIILYGGYALIQAIQRWRNPRPYRMLSRHWENLDQPRNQQRLARDLAKLRRKPRGWR